MSYPADLDIRPQAVQDAEAAALLQDDDYHDGGAFGVTSEQARAAGFVDAAEVAELRGES